MQIRLEIQAFSFFYSVVRIKLNKQKTRRPGPAGFGNFPLRSTLRELEAFAGAGLAVFFALAGARVAREEAFRFQRGAQVGVELQQRAGNPVARRAGLAVRAAAGDIRSEGRRVG